MLVGKVNVQTVGSLEFIRRSHHVERLSISQVGVGGAEVGLVLVTQVVQMLFQVEGGSVESFCDVHLRAVRLACRGYENDFADVAHVILELEGLRRQIPQVDPQNAMILLNDNPAMPLSQLLHQFENEMLILFLESI